MKREGKQGKERGKMVTFDYTASGKGKLRGGNFQFPTL